MYTFNADFLYLVLCRCTFMYEISILLLILLLLFLGIFYGHINSCSIASILVVNGDRVVGSIPTLGMVRF